MASNVGCGQKLARFDLKQGLQFEICNFLGRGVRSLDFALGSTIPSVQAAETVDYASDQAAPADGTAPNAFIFGDVGELTQKVEIIPNANGLKFNPHKDDQLKVVDEKVLVADGRGEALVELNPELPVGMTLWLDEGADEVFAFREGPWDGLVCLPATIGTAPGVVTGAATAVACHIAGDNLTTAANC